jgi:hypothetical protein
MSGPSHDPERLDQAAKAGPAPAQPPAGQAVSTIELDETGRRELAAALGRLERSRGLIVRLADLLGGAVNMAGRFGLRQIGLDRGTQHKFSGIAQAALGRAYDIAIIGLHRSKSRDVALSRAAVIASGAVSGFAGLAGFLPDATFTTLTIMREIARIAEAQGEDLSSDEARRACLEVFAFRSAADRDESELGYFSARLLFQGRPFTLLVSEIASRYGLVLGEKFSLQAVPVFGAIAGASLNAAFLDHYRNLAAAHFTIRRLERRHGRDVVRAASRLLLNPDLDLPFSAA